MSRQLLKKNQRRILLILLIILLCFLGVIILLITKQWQYNSSKSLTLNYKQINTFEKQIKELGEEKSYQKLKDSTTQLSFNTKHDFAHLYGKALYRVNPDGITTCDQDLNFGCYHGFFTEAILNEGTSAVTRLDQACEREGLGLYTGCQHGIGHGLVEYFSHNKIKEALEQCLPIQNTILLGCSSGIFMEYFFPFMPTNHSKTTLINPQDPFQVCNDIPQQFKNSCIYELPRLWRQTEPDPQKLIDRCDTLTDAMLQKSCYRGIGYATGSTVKPNPDFSYKVCTSITDAQKKLYCLSGATWFYTTIPLSETTTNAINKLCTESNDELLCRRLSDLNLDRMEDL